MRSICFCFSTSFSFSRIRASSLRSLASRSLTGSTSVAVCLTLMDLTDLDDWFLGRAACLTETGLNISLSRSLPWHWISRAWLVYRYVSSFEMSTAFIWYTASFPPTCSVRLPSLHVTILALLSLTSLLVRSSSPYRQRTSILSTPSTPSRKSPSNASSLNASGTMRTDGGSLAMWFREGGSASCRGVGMAMSFACFSSCFSPCFSPASSAPPASSSELPNSSFMSSPSSATTFSAPGPADMTEVMKKCARGTKGEKRKTKNKRRRTQYMQ